jgi:hypothetical protein
MKPTRRNTFIDLTDSDMAWLINVRNAGDEGYSVASRTLRDVFMPLVHKGVVRYTPTGVIDFDAKTYNPTLTATVFLTEVAVNMFKGLL